jgi:hypothetical protein
MILSWMIFFLRSMDNHELLENSLHLL